MKILKDKSIKDKTCERIAKEIGIDGIDGKYILFHDSLEISMPIYDHTETSRHSIYIFATSGQYIRQSEIQFYKNIKRTCDIYYQLKMS